MRLGFPSKANMMRIISKTSGCDLTVADIDLLPWNATETRVDTSRHLLSRSNHGRDWSSSRHLGKEIIVNEIETACTDDASPPSVVSCDSLESDSDSTQPPPEIESPRKTLNRLAEPLCDALDANIGKLSLNCDDLVDIEVHTDSDTGYVVEDDSDSLESAGESTPPPPEIGSPRKTPNRLAEPLCDALERNSGKLSLNSDDPVDIEVHDDSDTDESNDSDSDDSKATRHRHRRPKEPQQAAPVRGSTCFQDLLNSDSQVVDTILDTMQELIDDDLAVKNKSKRKFEKLFCASGGCNDLSRMLRTQLEKVAKMYPTHKKLTDVDQVERSDIMAELKVLAKALQQVCVLTCSPYDAKETIRVEFVKSGLIRCVVKIMKAFPVCAAMQWDACVTLWNLLQSEKGKKKGVKDGAMEALLQAAKLHPKSEEICSDALDTLGNLIEGSCKYTKLLLNRDAASVASNMLVVWEKSSEAHGSAKRLLKLMVKGMQSMIIG
jgi:hypothetical protein